jgi:hypothetical protein
MVYLPVLLLLGFSFCVQAKPCKKITRALLDLYPEHTKEIMLTRFENASNKHKFLRSFIPYYYQEIQKSASEIPALAKAGKTSGHIVGDAHVENFGYLVNNEGKSVLALNDFDDVAQAPLVLDVMRLSQSASYMDKEIDQAKLLKAYISGVKDSPHEYCDFIKRLGEKSKAGGHLSKAEMKIVGDRKLFAVKQEPNFVTSEAQKKILDGMLKKKYGSKAKLNDSYRTMKESGGSAYGKRYHLLAEINGQDHFIELKEVMDTGVVPKLLSQQATNTDRILNARDVFLGKNFADQLDVIKFEEMNFQLRFKAAGNKSIDLAKVQPENLATVIQDEFYLLGQLHRKSLGSNNAKIDNYLKDINSISTQEWDETLQFMRKKIRKAFDAANEK